MCDYIFVSRHRRALTISSSVRRPPSARSLGARCSLAALRGRRCITALCAPRDGNCPVPHRQTWFDVAGHRILLHEAIADDKSTVTAIATRLWRCALGTAAWLAEQAHVFDGQQVLEVGAGTGLCALVLIKASTARVVASDLDEAALELCSASARRMSLGLEVVRFDLCVAVAEAALPAATWLIACDVMYTPDSSAVKSVFRLSVFRSVGRAGSPCSDFARLWCWWPLWAHFQ